MIIVKIKASGAVLTPTQPVVTSGSGGTVRVCFEFDGEWQGLAKTAVFYTPHGNVFQAIENGACEFPAKALEAAGDIKVGVFGTDGERTLTSLLCRVRVSQGTTKNAERAANFAPGIYEQLYAKIDRVENIAAAAEYGEEAAAEIKEVDGVLTLMLTLPRGEKGEQGETGAQGPKGEKGEQGDAGADGYTPQRGVDYWTEEDKAEIELYIDEKLGDVETALDGIVALEEAYIGGESA